MNKVHDIDKLTVDQILVAMEIKKNCEFKAYHLLIYIEQKSNFRNFPSCIYYLRTFVHTT